MPLSPRMMDAHAQDVHHAAHLCAAGANIISKAKVARLMNFIVTKGHRKMGAPTCSAAFRNNLSGCNPREKTTHGDFVRKKSFVAPAPLFGGNGFQEYASAFPMTWQSFKSKVTRETGENEAGTVDGWLPNEAF